MQDQNTLLLNRQTGEGISHKLVFDMQVIPMGRKCKSVTGVMIYNAELVHIQMKFYVTEDEKRLIDEKMSQLPTRRYGAYLRKMAIDGYIIYTDTADIKAFTKELSAIGRNINQIAKRINAGGPAYQADMDEIRERLDEIWQLQRHILSNQR